MTKKRNFPDFIQAFADYAYDNYCPDTFHLWTGISVLAGALERKVWVRQGGTLLYPNLYTLLIAHPGVGKSTAILRGVDLLETLRESVNPNFKVIPNQITEPGLIEVMKIRGEMYIGKELVSHSSGYFYASEASASALQNLYGNFNSTITELYDCPRVFRKKIKGETETTEIYNLCFNTLAGATFDYLKNLVNEDSVMGGLASRFIYVISEERRVRKPKWHDEHSVDGKMRLALIEDISHINTLVGKFSATPEFIERWEKAQPEFDQYLIDLKSPRMESIMARKMTNTMKLAMLLAVSESDDLILREHHWERAVKLVDDVTKDNVKIIKSAMIAKVETQQGLNTFIFDTLEKVGGSLLNHELRAKILAYGVDSQRAQNTLNEMVAAKLLAIITDGAKTSYQILTKSEDNL